MSAIPPGLRALFDAAGPIIRYRLLRDVIGRDDSYIDTANRGLDLARDPQIAALVNAQQPDGTWSGILSIPPSRTRSGITGGQGGVGEKVVPHDSALRDLQAMPLSTESALLRLCELGRESSLAVGACVEKVLLPTLFNERVLWEFDQGSADANYRRAARHIVRDKVLRLLCRATRETDPVIKPHLETVLAEWDLFLASPDAVTIAPPTADAFAAVCWYPWSDDDLDRVHAIVKRLFEHADTRLDTSVPSSLPLFASSLFQLREKWDYLARPHVMLHDLELAARLGIVRELPATVWMLEELEAHQDADGMFRFDAEADVEPGWYFPLEARSAEGYPVEWSYRAALILKLLEYDL